MTTPAAEPVSHDIDLDELQHKEMSPALEATVSWGTSGLLHVGVALLVIASMYAVGIAKPKPADPPVIPSAGALDETLPTGPWRGHFGRDNDSTRQAMQDVIKNVPNPGFDRLGRVDGNIRELTAADGQTMEDAFISLGNGLGVKGGVQGEPSLGNGIGRLAAWGPPGGGSYLCPPTRINGRAPQKVVFVLDHSGSMLDTFDFLRQEVKRVMKSFTPAQQFAVIMFSKNVTVVGGEGLHRGLTDTKREIAAGLDQIRAAGENDDQLDPFKKSLEKAFALRPEVVVFLTDGKFDERLPSVVVSLNKDHKVIVNTIAFCKIEPTSERQLIEIAQKNGGKYKFVAEKDLGQQ